MNRISFAAILFFLLIHFCPAQNTAVTITGTVFPDETDKDGNPLSVYIEVAGKDDATLNYFITNDNKGKELLLHLYSTVNAAGMVQTTANKNTLTLQKYTVIDNPPEDLNDL
jgi:hypothetical protein